ncbi:MAG: hypothetical protein EAZ70_07020 [Runella slithyformis]|nr:MAG: hypothetical protein EAY79_06380 [Runella slithyformis]TAE99978.1 MAG: hypothetical protein EAZ80_04295 [Runella slithyformis]TAF27551.1 MAG: hypothetical protein EAZ70_07020 [Runella slithyformis]TAF46065.1 MAG: hypothetical protein EAZ63_09980 [Runella slithyformis]TAF82247.1 MAG: hypothetical protein EAZ50_04420 [Runella slithyformis]
MNFDILKILEYVYQSTLTSSNGAAEKIEVSIRAAAGIGALVYIFSRLIGQISRNEPIDFFPYLRPFLLVLLIASAPKMCDAMDAFGKKTVGLINASNGNLYEKVKKNTEMIQKKIRGKWDEIGTNPQRYKEMFGGDLNEDREALVGLGSVGVDFKIGFQQFSEEFKFQILSALQDVLMAIMHLAEAILFLISICYRLVLRMGAPIAFVLAIFPGFTQNIASWFGSYINYTLMPTVAALYSSIAFAASDAYLSAYDPATAVQSGGAEAQQPEYLGLAYIALLVMFLIGYFQVPSMTNMLVTVGGVGAMVQGATRMANQTLGNAASSTAQGMAGAGTRILRDSGAASLDGLSNIPKNVSAGIQRGADQGAANGPAGKVVGGVIGGVGGLAKSTVGATAAGVLKATKQEGKRQKNRLNSKINRL